METEELEGGKRPGSDHFQLCMQKRYRESHRSMSGRRKPPGKAQQSRLGK